MKKKWQNYKWKRKITNEKRKGKEQKMTVYYCNIGKIQKSVENTVNSLKAYAADAEDDSVFERRNAFGQLNSAIDETNSMINDDSCKQLLTPQKAQLLGSINSNLKSLKATWDLIQEYAIEKKSVNSKNTDQAVVRTISGDLSQKLEEISKNLNKLSNIR